MYDFSYSVKNWLSTHMISKSRLVTHDVMIRLVAKQLADKNCRLIESAKISSCSLDEKMLESLFTSCQEENDLQQRKVQVPCNCYISLVISFEDCFVLRDTHELSRATLELLSNSWRTFNELFTSPPDTTWKQSCQSKCLNTPGLLRKFIVHKFPKQRII